MEKTQLTGLIYDDYQFAKLQCYDLKLPRLSAAMMQLKLLKAQEKESMKKKTEKKT